MAQMLQEAVEELNVANVPQETLLSACEAIDKVHPYDGDDAKNTNDSKENRYKSECEHSVFPFWFVFLCWFPIISAVVTSYDRQGESVFYPLPVSGVK